MNTNDIVYFSGILVGVIILFFIRKKYKPTDMTPYIIMLAFSWMGVFMYILALVFNKYPKAGYAFTGLKGYHDIDKAYKRRKK